MFMILCAVLVVMVPIIVRPIAIATIAPITTMPVVMGPGIVPLAFVVMMLLPFPALPITVFVNVVVVSLYAHCFNSARDARSGLSQTSSFNSQLRVERDQRCGLRALA